MNVKKMIKNLSIKNFSTSKRKVTLFKGDGIGPEISNSVIEIFEANKIPVDWVLHDIAEGFAVI